MWLRRNSSNAPRRVDQPRNDRVYQRESASWVLSATCHVGLLVVAWLLFIGGAPGSRPTVIHSVWSDESPPDSFSDRVVELEPEVQSGGLASRAEAAAVLAQVGGPRVGEPGVRLGGGGGFGGAFFGVGGGETGLAGKRIVYIVDASGSMQEYLIRVTRFGRVQRELENSILSLSAEQQFAVILFNKSSRSVSARSLRNATDRVKIRTIGDIWDSQAGGGTNPSGAINRALRLRPDTIYFLTDGVFDASNASALLKPREGLTVHTFTLGDASGEAIMRRIAEVNGGTYKFVDGKPTTSAATAAPPGTSPPAPVKSP